MNKAIKDVDHWKQLIASHWLRGVDLSPDHDTILTVKSVTYGKHGKGTEGELYAIHWAEPGWKPYGTATVECLKAVESVYGTADPNKWVAGQKLALYPKLVAAFGRDAEPAVRIRPVAPNPVSAEQLATLTQMIEATRDAQTTPRLLAWAQATSLDNVPASKYDEACRILQAKIDKGGN